MSVSCEQPPPPSDRLAKQGATQSHHTPSTARSYPCSREATQGATPPSPANRQRTRRWRLPRFLPLPPRELTAEAEQIKSNKVGDRRQLKEGTPYELVTHYVLLARVFGQRERPAPFLDEAPSFPLPSSQNIHAETRCAVCLLERDPDALALTCLKVSRSASGTGRGRERFNDWGPFIKYVWT